MKLSIRKYATLRGCSEGNIRAAIKTGKIKDGVVFENGKIKGINVEIADKEWKENYNFERVRNSSLIESLESGSKNEKGSIEKPYEKKEAVCSNEKKRSKPSNVINAIESESTMTISDAKKKEAILKAKKLELEIAEMEGKLIDAEKVRKDVFEYGTQVKNAILRVPDLVVDNILSMTTRHEVHVYLMTELNNQLSILSKSNM